MDIVRNFIHVIGITPEDELPNKVNGQAIQYSDIETIYIPEEKPPAEGIFQVSLDVEIKSKRIINAPLCKTMVIDGVKKVKIIYGNDGSLESAYLLELEIPYNTFIELNTENNSLDKVDVYIIDAYFHLLDNRRVYCYLLYLVTANYSHKINNGQSKGDYINSISQPYNENTTSLSMRLTSDALDDTTEEVQISVVNQEDIALNDYEDLQDTGQTGSILIDIDSEYL